MQVVNATCVLDVQAGLQEWLGGGRRAASLRLWLCRGCREAIKNTGIWCSLGLTPPSVSPYY